MNKDTVCAEIKQWELWLQNRMKSHNSWQWEHKSEKKQIRKHYLLIFHHEYSCGPMDCSPPGSSVHGIFSGKNTGVGCHFLLKRIFPTQGSSLRLLLSRWILHHPVTWEAWIFHDSKSENHQNLQHKHGSPCL